MQNLDNSFEVKDSSFEKLVDNLDYDQSSIYSGIFQGDYQDCNQNGLFDEN